MKFVYLLLILALPNLAEAATYWTSLSGTDVNACNNSLTPLTTGAKQTIAGGMGCLKPGDTLYIRSGTYNERITSVTSGGGTEATRTVIAGYPGETVTIFPLSDVQQVVMGPGVGTSWITFNNLVLDCTHVTLSESCVSSSATNSHLRFSNLEIKNTGASTSGGTCGNGMLIRGSLNEIQHVHSHDNGKGAPPAQCNPEGGYGLYLTGNNTIVEYSEFDHNGGWGIHNYDYGHTDVSDNTYRFNLSHDNHVIGPGSGGILLDNGSNNVAYGNIVYADSIGSGGGITISGTCSSCAAYNNTIYGGLSWGIIDNGTGSIIKNNLLYQNAQSEPGTLDFFHFGTGFTYSNNMCGDGSTDCDAALRNKNPLFVSTTPGNANFLKLGPGSPAINAGANLGSSYASDMANVARPSTGPWEIGAYEYVVTVPQVNQLVLALPLDAGGGSTAVDVSGQNNNATLVGGATWDNAGKFGKAIMFDGSGYLNVPASQSLALAPAMTLEAWIYPTVSFSGFAAVIVGNYQYYLYAASDAGSCPAGPPIAPLGGYSIPGADNFICATSLPPVNQWSYLAVTHDGATTTFYLDGNVIASRSSTTSMLQASNNVTIGASTFGEYFIGKIDEPRIYTYARTPAQIQGDMNTPLIGPPGKYLEVASPTSVEISAASTLEIGAD